ncbi:hypothetical protein AWC27_04875 [Mycobacterium szulgai]|uniref:Uncharacterized protein n=1 Tax=Mycobacterium szulgai TaxID=1787 RepID=A0A1X2E960_MYCSZ|nr:hypothetical protein AWC27_04875 [Mycobacterium szulgai]
MSRSSETGGELTEIFDSESLANPSGTLAPNLLSAGSAGHYAYQQIGEIPVAQDDVCIKPGMLQGVS